MKKQSLTLINIGAIVLIVVLTAMLFMPFFRYTVNAGKSNEAQGTASIAAYGWRPTATETKDVIKYIKAEFPNTFPTDGDFAFPVVVLTLGSLAAVAGILVLMKSPRSGFVIAGFGFLGVWAFLSMKPLWLGGAQAVIMFVLYCLMVVVGLVLGALSLEKKSRNEDLILNIICGALALLLIVLVFTVGSNGTSLSFSLEGIGKKAENNPYLAEAANKYFGKAVLPDPIVMLLFAAMTVAVTVFSLRKNTPVWLQLFTGALCVYTLLSNRVFDSNYPMLQAGLACSLPLVLISLMRAVICGLRGKKSNALACRVFTVAILFTVLVLALVPFWQTGKTGVLSVLGSVTNPTGVTSLNTRLTAELQSEMTLTTTKTAEEIAEFTADTGLLPICSAVLILLCLAGIVLNVIGAVRKEGKHFALNLLIAVIGLVILAAGIWYRYSVLRLWMLLLLGAAAVINLAFSVPEAKGFSMNSIKD